MRRFPFHPESPNTLYIVYNGRNLYRVELNLSSLKRSIRHMISAKKGDQRVVDYTILDKDTAIVLLTWSLLVIDIPSQEEKWTRLLDCEQPCLLIAPNF